MTTPTTESIVQQIPRFVIPPDHEGKIPGAEPAKPAAPVEPAPSAPAAEPEAKGKEAEQDPNAKPETQDETTGKDPDEAKRRQSALDRRTSRAIRRAAEERARAEALERENAELKARVGQQPRAGTDPEPGEPRMEDYTDVKEFAKAYAKWETDKALTAREQAAKAETAKQEQTRVSAEWTEQVTKAAEKYEDFDEVVGDLKFGVTPWGDAIMLSENGGDVAYYLGTHEKEAARIMALPPKKQFIEIGKISHRLSVAPEAPKRPSKAPAPITPVAAPAAVKSDEIRPGQSPEEYFKIGNKLFRGK